MRGVLHDESGPGRLTHRFHDRALLDRRTGATPILQVRVASGDDVIDLELLGSVQHDGLLTVTIALHLRHPSAGAEEGGEGLEAETTAVAHGSSSDFALMLLDADGCRVRALGSVANGTAEPGADPR